MSEHPVASLKSHTLVQSAPSESPQPLRLRDVKSKNARGNRNRFFLVVWFTSVLTSNALKYPI